MSNWSQRCRRFLSSRKNLRNGWLVSLGLAALYVGLIRPYESLRGINNSRGTGLSAANSEPARYWRGEGLFHQFGAFHGRGHVAGVVGGVPGGIANSKAVAARTAAFLSTSVTSVGRQDAHKSGGNENDQDRKMVRTSYLELEVAKPEEAAEKIRALAERSGGFLVTSEVRGDQYVSVASLTIRVPFIRYEQVRAEILRLALRVESEKIEAQDVTRQYVDQAANLRNLRAEESQYLTILKQARTVKDTLDISEKLSEVRGQIEQQQAEFAALSKQIETVAINITMRTVVEAQVFGLSWRPLYQIKVALRDGLDGVASYASTMTAVLFFLPTVALWLVTLAAGGAIAWRLLRWVARRWFGWRRTEAAPRE